MHYDDVIMSAIASQYTSLTIVYSTVYSGADQSKHQSSASRAFVWGIHRGPVNSPHKCPVTRKLLPFWWRHYGSWIVKPSNEFTICARRTYKSTDTQFLCVTFLLTVPAVLTHWGPDKMAVIFQTTFWNVFSWIKMCELRLRFHWTLFLWVQLTIFQATSHCLNQWLLIYWRIYASLGLDVKW